MQIYDMAWPAMLLLFLFRAQNIYLFIFNCIIIILLNINFVKVSASNLTILSDSTAINCSHNQFCENFDYGPQSAYVPCEYLPYDFFECDDLIDHQGNETSFELSGIGCLKFGGQHSKGYRKINLSLLPFIYYLLYFQKFMSELESVICFPKSSVSVIELLYVMVFLVFITMVIIL